MGRRGREFLVLDHVRGRAVGEGLARLSGVIRYVVLDHVEMSRGRESPLRAFRGLVAERVVAKVDDVERPEVVSALEHGFPQRRFRVLVFQGATAAAAQVVRGT